MIIANFHIKYIGQLPAYVYFFMLIGFTSNLNLPVLISYLKFKAISTYYNTDVQKKQILVENKGKSGIYRWKNLINGNTYIGSSIDLRIRFSNYFNVNYLVS